MVRLEMNDMNRQNALDAIAEIETYEFPSEIQRDLEELKKSVRDYNTEITDRMVDRLLTEIRILRNNR